MRRPTIGTKRSHRPVGVFDGNREERRKRDDCFNRTRFENFCTFSVDSGLAERQVRSI